MSLDPVLARELQSLRDELAAVKSSRNGEASRGVHGAERVPERVAEDPIASPNSNDDADLRDLIGALHQFVATAEQNIANHPVAAVSTALVAGILIGRSLGR